MYETEILAAANDGKVAFVCSVATCGEIATIMIEHPARAEQPLCPEHWQQARRLTPRSLNAVRTLPRPYCFVTRCAEGAVAIIEHTDGSLLPCCESHLDDLSWVVPDEVGTGCRR